VEVAHRNNALFEFRAALPPAALGWQQMDVTLAADRAPLLFGWQQMDVSLAADRAPLLFGYLEIR
jgi:hypothetical protein